MVRPVNLKKAHGFAVGAKDGGINWHCTAKRRVLIDNLQPRCHFFGVTGCRLGHFERLCQCLYHTSLFVMKFFRSLGSTAW